MRETELVCPKCGYRNQSHRSNCKNCGKALTAETAVKQQVVTAKRRKPLKHWTDWLLAVLGAIFLVPAVFFGAGGIGSIVHLQFWGLVLLFISAGLLYGTISFTAIPIYSLYIYKKGHETAESEIINSYEKTYERNEGSSHTESYIVIDFVPEKASDPRRRHLTCKVGPGTMIRSGNNKISVYYALKDPNVMLFEGEV